VKDALFCNNSCKSTGGLNGFFLIKI